MGALPPGHEKSDEWKLEENAVGPVLAMGVENSAFRRPVHEPGVGTTGVNGKGIDFVKYTRRKKEGRDRSHNLSTAKHARILSKLNLTITPIRKQLIIGSIPTSSKTSLVSTKKGGGGTARHETEEDSVQSMMRHRVPQIN